jgi:hypothetical protein
VQAAKDSGKKEEKKKDKKVKTAPSEGKKAAAS